ANASGELWLAEGFTQYYEQIVLARAGLETLADTTRALGGFVDAIINDPGRQVRTVEEMSRMAPFVDGGQPNDRTNFRTTAISYYTAGAAIALALDMALRDRSNGRQSLDDFMRELWRRFGKPGGAREGYVDHPYTAGDAEAALAAVVGDPRFSRDFFARYIQ